MGETMQIRGEQIQDKVITSRHIKDIDIGTIYNNGVPLINELSKYISLTILKENWNNKEYVINDDNISLTSNGQLLNNNQNSISEIIKSNINIKEQTDGQLILSCDITPNIDLQLVLLLN